MASYILGVLGVILIIIGGVAVFLSPRTRYLPWGKLLGKLSFGATFGGMAVLGVTGLVTLFVVQLNKEDQHARDVARKMIAAKLRTVELISVGEQEYYRQYQAFTDDLNVLYDNTTNRSLRHTLVPLAVDGHDRNFPLQLVGSQASPVSVVKITSSYYSHHLGQGNDYSLFLTYRDGSFSVDRLCSAYYYCTDHRWTGLPEEADSPTG